MSSPEPGPMLSATEGRRIDVGGLGIRFAIDGSASQGRFRR